MSKVSNGADTATSIIGFLFFGVLAFEVFTIATYCVGYGGHEVCVDKMISRVGGCNDMADCGVLYSDETKGIERYPVVGEIVSVCQWEKESK